MNDDDAFQTWALQCCERFMSHLSWNHKVMLPKPYLPILVSMTQSASVHSNESIGRIQKLLYVPFIHLNVECNEASLGEINALF